MKSRINILRSYSQSDRNSRQTMYAIVINGIQSSSQSGLLLPAACGNPASSSRSTSSASAGASPLKRSMIRKKNCTIAVTSRIME